MFFRNCKVLYISVILVIIVSGSVQARPKVAVLPFRNPPGFDSACPLGSGLAEVVRKMLMDSGKVEIVGREDLDLMKQELNLSRDGFFDPSTFPKKGGFQGADFLITGKILDFGHFSKDTGIGALGKMAGGFTQTKTTAFVRLALEVVDLKNGKLVFSKNAEEREERKGAVVLAGDIKKVMGGAIKIGSSKFDNSMLGKATYKALNQVVPPLFGLFKLEAKVLAVGSEGIVIDMGSSSGLKAGLPG